jgi:hypothetical protein
VFLCYSCSCLVGLFFFMSDIVIPSASCRDDFQILGGDFGGAGVLGNVFRGL